MKLSNKINIDVTKLMHRYYLFTLIELFSCIQHTLDYFSNYNLIGLKIYSRREELLNLWSIHAGYIALREKKKNWKKKYLISGKAYVEVMFEKLNPDFVVNYLEELGSE